MGTDLCCFGNHPLVFSILKCCTRASCIVTYVNHRFTISMVTVIFALCRDFWWMPWFCVTTMITGMSKICTISPFRRSMFWKYAFPSWMCIVCTTTHSRRKCTTCCGTLLPCCVSWWHIGVGTERWESDSQTDMAGVWPATSDRGKKCLRLSASQALICQLMKAW